MLPLVRLRWNGALLASSRTSSARVAHLIAIVIIPVSTCKGVAEEDPDLALARILQEQERAFWLLAGGGYAGQPDNHLS